MKEIPRKDLEGDGTSPFIAPVQLEEIFYKNFGRSIDGFIMPLPEKYYPMELIHQDDNGYLLLLHEGRLYVAKSRDFDEWEVNS